MKTVPVVRLDHLSDAEKRAYILADNKIALNAGWDTELLATELGELADLSFDIDLDLEITGFETGQIDAILHGFVEPASAKNDEDELPQASKVVVAKRGDIWQLGGHRIMCGDARESEAVGKLFEGNIASLVLTDPPYNVKVQGHRPNTTSSHLLQEKCLTKSSKPSCARAYKSCLRIQQMARYSLSSWTGVTLRYCCP